MSIATGIGQAMIGAGYWPEDGIDAVDSGVTVERTDEDEIALRVHYIGQEGGGGTIYLTPEMASELANKLSQATSRAAWPTTGD